MQNKCHQNILVFVQLTLHLISSVDYITNMSVLVLFVIDEQSANLL